MAMIKFGDDSTTTDAFAVAVYKLDMRYAGPEEGGRWQTLRELVAVVTADSDEAATALALELGDGEYKNTGRPLSSVNFGRSGNDKAYSLLVCKPGEPILYDDNDSSHYE